MNILFLLTIWDKLTRRHTFTYKLPDDIDYLLYGSAIIISVLILKRVRYQRLTKKNRTVIAFQIIVSFLICRLFIAVIFSCISIFYGYIFYPKYDAKVVDFVIQEHRGRRGYYSASHAIIEFKDNSDQTIRIMNNESDHQETAIGDHIKIYYHDNQVVEYSIYSIIQYSITLLISIFFVVAYIFWVLTYEY